MRQANKMSAGVYFCAAVKPPEMSKTPVMMANAAACSPAQSVTVELPEMRAKAAVQQELDSSVVTESEIADGVVEATEKAGSGSMMAEHREDAGWCGSLRMCPIEGVCRLH